MGKKNPQKGFIKEHPLGTHKETQKVKTPKEPKKKQTHQKNERGKGVHGINNNKKRKKRKETGERKKLPELGRELRELSTLEPAFSRQLPIEKEKGKGKEKATKELRKNSLKICREVWNGSSFYRRFSRSSSSI